MPESAQTLRGGPTRAQPWRENDLDHLAPQVADPATAEFEELLWEQLREVHAADEQPWAPDVSDDPDDPHFAFSGAGTAYFVVGLHPKASRDARRAAVPTLVFNLHAQFEELRTSGAFPGMRDLIRARDEALQGQINPMVSAHGESSECRQYSGRQVSAKWQAPFEAGPGVTHDQSDDADSNAPQGT